MSDRILDSQKLMQEALSLLEKEYQEKQQEINELNSRILSAQHQVEQLENLIRQHIENKSQKNYEIDNTSESSLAIPIPIPISFDLDDLGSTHGKLLQEEAPSEEYKSKETTSEEPTSGENSIEEPMSTPIEEPTSGETTSEEPTSGEISTDESPKILGETFEPKEKIIVDAAKSDQPLWMTAVSGEHIDYIQEALSLNDRMCFTRELFDLDDEKFEETIETINVARDFSEVVSYMRENFPHMNENSDSVYKFYMLVRRRFK